MLARVLHCTGERIHKADETSNSAGGVRKRMDPASMDWRHEASCRDVDPELFFPIGSTGPALSQIEAARAICGTCDVQAPCLEWALATGQDAGIWGGMTEEERRAVRRDRVVRQRVAV